MAAQPRHRRDGHRIRRATRRFLSSRGQRPCRPGVGRRRHHPRHGDGARVGIGKSPRQVWWLHTTQSVATYAFAAEITALTRLAFRDARQHVFYTRGDDAPAASRPTVDHRTRSADRRHRIPLRPRPRSWTTSGQPSRRPGCDPTQHPHRTVRRVATDQPRRGGWAAPTRPHPPEGRPGRGTANHSSPAADSSVNWSPGFHTLLEIAEACDVPTRYSCRSGVCHTCETAVIEGSHRLPRAAVGGADRRHRAVVHGHPAHRPCPRPLIRSAALR